MKRLNTLSRWHTKNNTRWYIWSIIAIFVLNPSFLVSTAGKSNEPPNSISEFVVKAVMLKNCCLHIEWPEGSDVNDPNKPFTIVVLGKSPIIKELQAFYIDNEQRIKDKNVQMQAISDKDDIPPCDLLFISRSAKYRLIKIIAAIENNPILIVSDTEGFAERGVHLNFIIRHKELRFEVNLEAVEKSRLVPSHHLLKAALRIIKPPEEKEILKSK